MKSILTTLLKDLTGTVLYWLSGSIVVAFMLSIPRLLDGGKLGLLWLCAFLTGLVLFHYYRFPSCYVFAHEATHWLIAKLFRRETGKFRVCAKGGYVQVSNPNIWITLSPYILPLYVLVVMGLFGLSELFYFPPTPLCSLIFANLLGLAYAYHVVLTLHVLGVTQSDLEAHGSYLSIAIILIGNLLLLFLALMLCTPRWSIVWEMLLKCLDHQWSFTFGRI